MIAAAFAVLVCLGAAGSAAADEPERPWASGVSTEQQVRATELFERGNTFLDEGLFAKALELFEEALTHWSHPAIHYNAAVALINLERRIEAFEHLEQALRFDGAALESDVRDRARDYQRLLAGQLGKLTVRCEQGGTRVSLDGKQLLACPGSATELLLAGEHQLVAAKAGYLTRTAQLFFAGGDSRSVTIELIPLEQATVTRRRWDAWKPWAVVGAGLAVGLAGAGFEAKSEASFDSYDEAVAVLCADRPCDDLPESVTDAYDRGRWENRVGIGLIATGGAAVAAGVVLLILNRPTEERIGYDDLVVTPMVGSDGVGIAGQLRF